MPKGGGKGGTGAVREGADSRHPNLYWRNGIAWGRAKVAGKPIRRSLSTRDRDEALKRVKAFVADIEHLRFYGEVRHTYADAVIAWVADGMGGVDSELTKARYQTSLRQLHPHFGGLYLDQIDRKQVAAYVRTRKAMRVKGRPIKNATIKRDLTALSRLLSYCVAQGWRDDNPARDWDRSVIREKRTKIVRPEQASIDAVIAEAPLIFGLYLEFVLAEGLRATEAACIRRRDIDWQAGTLTLKTTKRDKPRTLQLSARGLAILKRVPARIDVEPKRGNWQGHNGGPPLDEAAQAKPKRGQDFLFWTPAGGRYSDPSRTFIVARRCAQKGAQKKGVDFTPYRLHDLRHEFAIRWLEEGGGIYPLSRHMGHSSVKTTEIYLEAAEMTDAQQEAAKNAMSAPASREAVA